MIPGSNEQLQQEFSVNTVSMSKTVPFQAIQFSIITQFKCKYSLSKEFLFQAIHFSQTVQFSISMQLGPYLWIK